MKDHAVRGAGDERDVAEAAQCFDEARREDGEPVRRRQVGRLKNGVVVERRRFYETEGASLVELPVHGGAGAGKAENER